MQVLELIAFSGPVLSIPMHLRPMGMRADAGKCRPVSNRPLQGMGVEALPSRRMTSLSRSACLSALACKLHRLHANWNLESMRVPLDLIECSHLPSQDGSLGHRVRAFADGEPTMPRRRPG